MASSQQNSVFRRDIPYSLDFDDYGDLKPLEDIDAINQSLKTILVSNFGDKPLEENFGANGIAILGDNATPPGLLEFELRKDIENASKSFEPNIIIEEIIIDMQNINKQEINIMIKYKLSDGVTSGLFDESISLNKGITPILSN